MAKTPAPAEPEFVTFFSRMSNHIVQVATPIREVGPDGTMRTYNPPGSVIKFEQIGAGFNNGGRYRTNDENEIRFLRDKVKRDPRHISEVPMSRDSDDEGGNIAVVAKAFERPLLTV